jgi:hypothetical protein
MIRDSSRCASFHAFGSDVPVSSAYVGSGDWPGWIFTGLVIRRAISMALIACPRCLASQRYS